MKHYTLKIIVLLGVLGVLGGCSSTLDYDFTEVASNFHSHKQISESFKGLEQRVDMGDTVTRNSVHASGFVPGETPIIIIDSLAIAKKFTAGGDQVLQAEIERVGGTVIPEAVLECIKAQKLCTAYRIFQSVEQSKEKPEGFGGTVQSVFDLKEIRHIRKWSFQGLIVFNDDIAVFAQVEASVTPNVTITEERNSLIKKIGHAVTP
jgi:hypothetical protein